MASSAGFDESTAGGADGVGLRVRAGAPAEETPDAVVAALVPFLAG